MTRLEEMIEFLENFNFLYSGDDEDFGEDFKSTSLLLIPIVTELVLIYGDVPQVEEAVKTHMELLSKAGLYHSLNKN